MPNYTNAPGGSLKMLTSEPCKYGRCPPEHNHQHDPFDASKPGYYPEPEDLIPGWTAQHLVRDRSAGPCPIYCILCWEAEATIDGHACMVLETLTP